MPNASVYRCGIIGLGRMGAGLLQPHTTDPARKPWTHKMAYEMHPRCELIWGLDKDIYRSFGDNKNRVHIVSVCTPSSSHYADVTGIANERPKAIFCEKPLAPTVEECDEIIAKCRENKVVLAVNHQRAWEMPAVVSYSGDPLECGTHAAELSNRMGWKLEHWRSDIKNIITVHLQDFEKGGHVKSHYGPLVSLKAIDDIIDCIEGRKEKPACDGWAGREAVRVALEPCKYAQAI